MILSRNSATCFISPSLYPLVVQAGVPRRMTPGLAADLSPAIVFLFRVTFVWLHADSTFDPVRFKDLTFQSTMWLSVPSVTSVCPFYFKASAKALAFALICLL